MLVTFPSSSPSCCPALGHFSVYPQEVKLRSVLSLIDDTAWRLDGLWEWAGRSLEGRLEFRPGGLLHAGELRRQTPKQRHTVGPEPQASSQLAGHWIVLYEVS